MKKSFAKLRYLTEYVLFKALFSLLKSLKLEQAASFCAFIARIIGPLLPSTQLARRNIKYVRLESNDQKINIIIQQALDNFGRFIGEFAHLNLLTDDELSKRIEVENFELLEELCVSNQPFILFAAHLANWDLALSKICTLNKEIGVVYRKANNPYIDEQIRKIRQRSNVKLIEKGRNGFKELMSCIKAKTPIIMLVDQKMNQGIKVDFFGKTAMTVDAIARIALQFKYKLIPAQVIRINHSSKFKAIIHPELLYLSTSDMEKDVHNIMVQINLIIEGWVREHPTQWFWFHNRWGLER